MINLIKLGKYKLIKIVNTIEYTWVLRMKIAKTMEKDNLIEKFNFYSIQIGPILKQDSLKKTKNLVPRGFSEPIC